MFGSGPRNQERIIHLLEEIILHLKMLENDLRHHYSFRITETTMAIGSIPPGTSGTFAAQFLDNGQPSPTPPAHAPVWTVDDTNVTLTPSADGTSCVAEVGATDTSTSFTLTVSATAPDGTTATGSLTVQIPAPVVNKYSFTITQTA